MKWHKIFIRKKWEFKAKNAGIAGLRRVFLTQKFDFLLERLMSIYVDLAITSVRLKTIHFYHTEASNLFVKFLKIKDAVRVKDEKRFERSFSSVTFPTSTGPYYHYFL